MENTELVRENLRAKCPGFLSADAKKRDCFGAKCEVRSWFVKRMPIQVLVSNKARGNFGYRIYVTVLEEKLVQDVSRGHSISHKVFENIVVAISKTEAFGLVRHGLPNFVGQAFFAAVAVEGLQSAPVIGAAKFDYKFRCCAW